MGFPSDVQPPGTEEPDRGENEREDGEISDEFEDISSDEEFSMRKRIEELEARNLELEKIAKISGTYDVALDYPKEITQRSHEVLEDISDCEEYVPTYYEKPKSTVHKAIKLRGANNKEKYNKNETSKKYKNIFADLPSIEVEIVNNKAVKKTKTRKRKHEKPSRCRCVRKKHKVKKKITTPNVTSSDDDSFQLNRDELRLALHRDCGAPNKGNLKNVVEERFLQAKDTIDNDSFKIVKKKLAVTDSDDSNENELRLAALKSAIYKKHKDRKMREEREGCKPYSPTDFLNVLTVPSDGLLSNNSLIGDEENDMDISPITSAEYDGEDDSILKSTDMDLASSSNCPSPVFNSVPDSGNKTELQDKLINNSETENYYKFNGENVMNNEDDVVHIHNVNTSAEHSDEEEAALRALLLAKMSTKRFKKKSISKSVQDLIIDVDEVDTSADLNNQLNHAPQSVIDNESVKSELTSSDQDNSVDLDSLRNFLISNMNKKSVNTTELVLKEAVKRLKYQIQDVCTLKDNEKEGGSENNFNVNSNSASCDASLFDSQTYETVPPEMNKAQMDQKVEEPVNQTESVTNTTIVTEEIVEVNKEVEQVQVQNLEESVKCDIQEPHDEQEKPIDTSGPEPPPVVEQLKTSLTEKLIRKEEEKHIRKQPLKAINKNSQLLTKVIRRNSLSQHKALTAIKRTVSKTKVINHNPLSASTINKPTSRLITSIDPTRKVQRIVINVGQTDSSESDDPDVINTPNVNPVNIQIEDEDYCDNASPKSLQMESPCYSPAPIRAKDSISVTVNGKNKSANPDLTVKTKSKGTNEYLKDVRTQVTDHTFEDKLDEYLKNVRSKVENTKKSTDPAPSTPLAVRHLPPSSQLEYRRLVNRMKILEKQKQAKMNTIANKTIPLQTAVANEKLKTAKGLSNCTEATITDSVHKITVNENTKDSANSKLVDKVVPVNNSEEKENVVIDNCNASEKEILKKNNLEKLEQYETEYDRTSACLIEEINKTLDLVKQAKEEKMKKITLEHEIKQLKNQLLEAEQKLLDQNKIISGIYPEISSLNEGITRLRKRHVVLLKMSSNLGKHIKGDEYQLKDHKGNIYNKSMELACEIRKLKNLKRSNSVIENDSEKVDQSKETEVAQCSPEVITENQNESEIQTDTISKEDTISNQIVITPENVLPIEERLKVEYNIKENCRMICPEEHLKGERKWNRLRKFTKYISPLNYTGPDRPMNPCAIICPYQLMGQCDDKECKYEHLPNINPS